MLPKPVPSSADGPPPVRLLVAVEEFDPNLVKDFTEKAYELVEALEAAKADDATMAAAVSLPIVALMAEHATEVPMELRASAVRDLCQGVYQLTDRTGNREAMLRAGWVEMARLEMFGLPGGTSFVKEYFGE